MNQRPLDVNNTMTVPRKKPHQKNYKSKKEFKAKNNFSYGTAPAFSPPIRKPAKYPGKKPYVRPVRETERKPKDLPGRKQKKSFLTKLKPVVIYLAFFAAGILLVAHSAYISYTNYQVMQYEQKLEDLNNQKNYLELKVLEQKSPARLEEIATENLKMVNPGREEVIHIE